jgi:RNA polymerase sigma factor (sigma-70 family)
MERGREDTFERLLAAARTGDESAWRELYLRIAPAVLGYLRARGAPDPDDLAGEVLLQVVRDLSGFDGSESGFRAWVFTIAHHRLLDDRRRRARRPEDPVPDPTGHGDEAAGDVEQEALAWLGLERVAHMLGALSPDQRDVLLLRIVGELSVDQVAIVVGKRPGAVKQLQRRGLAAIRRRLEREGVAR